MITVSNMLDQLASIAWDGRLRGSTLERSSLLYPVGEVLNKMAQLGGPLDKETLIVATAQDIFNHVDRISDQKYRPGEKVYAAAEAFARGWFENILETAYRNNMASLLRDAKLLRSAYLFYIQSKIPQKSAQEN